MKQNNFGFAAPNSPCQTWSNHSAKSAKSAVWAIKARNDSPADGNIFFTKLIWPFSKRARNSCLTKKLSPQSQPIPGMSWYVDGSMLPPSNKMTLCSKFPMEHVGSKPTTNQNNRGTSPLKCKIRWRFPVVTKAPIPGWSRVMKENTAIAEETVFAFSNIVTNIEPHAEICMKPRCNATATKITLDFGKHVDRNTQVKAKLMDPVIAEYHRKCPLKYTHNGTPEISCTTFILDSLSTTISVTTDCMAITSELPI
mmetsp:Transcript_1790/g.5283  ORF Transcript_1790/g.5283 Transcript_1790/m.5283 type:complete len:254 (-) Transcript_1790:348-1109(-)